MGRQNTGKPKFYVDLIQYWYAKGLVAGIGYYGDTDNIGYPGGIENICPEGYIPESDGSGWSPELIGFNPYNYTYTNRGFNSYQENHSYLNQAVVLKEKVLLPESGTMFVSFLNHSFDHCKFKLGDRKIVQALKTWSNWQDEVLHSTYDTGYGGGYQYDGNWDVESTDITEICNFDDSRDGHIAYNGFSIAEFDSSSLNGVNHNLDSATLGLPSSPAGLNDIARRRGTDLIFFGLTSELPYGATAQNKNFILGSMNLGISYTMPNTSDLSLSMTREFDGIDSTMTKSGSSITNIRYDGPPPWRDNLGAWELHNTGSVEYKKWLFRDKVTRGRRVWDLKFSYLSSDDLFSPTELYTGQSGSVQADDDGDNNTANYPDGDFQTSTSFRDNFNESNSFMSVVMARTMGGNLPFIFQPDSNNNSADQFAICKVDQKSIKFDQVAHNVYDISLKIREVW